LASASASSLRLIRSLALALGFAVFLAAIPGASVVPAVAGTSAAASVSAVSQDPNDPNPPDDNSDDNWTEDEDNQDNQVLPDSLPEGLQDKPASIVPDSVRFGAGSSLPSGSAPPETLGFKAPGVGIGPPVKAVAVKPKERRTPFGIHPAALFAVLIVGHVFLVRAVTK